MRILHECPQKIDAPATVITIGTFDGVHQGHQKILKRLSEIKHEKHLKSIVFTFHPHPRKILCTHSDPIKILSTPSEKIQLLQNYDIDYLIFCPFTKEFANTHPHTFVKYLAEHLNMQHIIIGYDHKFGKDRQGSIHTFLELKDHYNFEIEQIPAATIHEINISSTKIRSYLLTGNIEEANQLLGYSYFISGKVIEGKKLGTQLGIPTANIQIEDEDKLVPANGIYCTWVKINDQNYKGTISIGTNPTTDTDHQKKLEVHILDFNETIYDKNIQVYFLKRIREEKKFETIEALKKQMLKDIETCR